MKRVLDKKKSKKIIDKLSAFYPDVKPGLEYRNLFQLSVSVVLSAQTTDRQVNSVTPGLFGKYPDFKSLSVARVKEVEGIIRSTGFYRNKAMNIVNLAKAVMEKFGGNVPREMNALTTLPGVGRKSANIILSMGYGIPAMAVDTHVLRIANRLGYAETSKPDEAEEALKKTIPEKDWIHTHLLFIKHGRSLCRARNPLCPECPVTRLCLYFDNNSYTP